MPRRFLLPQFVPLLALVVSLAPAALRAEEPKPAESAPAAPTPAVPKLAAIVTVYHHNSHADMLVSRMLQGYLLNGTGEFPKSKLASLYTDQVPDNDTSRDFSKKYGFPICASVDEALTLGTGKLAVDGVLLICEHGKYENSARGQILYPKRRLFEQIIAVFKKSERVVPIFNDKHLADTWQDAKYMYDTCTELKIPFMAGSSLPLAWRYPAIDMPRGAKIKELLVTSYGPFEGYNFHALEMAQALVERRNGGETGIASVEIYKDAEVWKAADAGVFDRELLAAACTRLKDRPLPAGADLVKQTPKPILVSFKYRDGLKVNLLMLEALVVEWTAAWRAEDNSIQSTISWTLEARPLMHFTYLFKGIEQMVLTGKPSWPVERTLLTTGMLAAMCEARHTGRRIETPELEIKYQSDWNFQQPPESPPARPLNEQ